MTEETTQVATINPNFDKTVDMKDMKFRFRKDKELGTQRPTVELQVPVPSVEGIVSIIEKGGKGLELLLEIVADTVRSSVSEVVSADESAKQETIDWTKHTFEAIANQPREDRRASKIDPALWTEFAKDYIEVMPGVTGKKPEAVSTAAELFLKKLSIVKTNKPVLSMLKNQLALYTEHSPNAEQFSEIIDMLNRRADVYLSADDVSMLIANL